MTINIEDLLNSIQESLDRIEYIRAEDIPEIDLYMDQVTTFMESHLRNTTRDPASDKILTKTMINNYAKNNLLPPPSKKKYSRDHVLLLIFIYYYKGILSISDIQALLGPITDKFFHNKPRHPYCRGTPHVTASIKGCPGPGTAFPILRQSASSPRSGTASWHPAAK